MKLDVAVKFGLNGELPDGWATARLGRITELKYGKGLPQKTRVSGKFDVYGSNGKVGTHRQALTSGPTIIVGRKGSVGAVHLSPQPCWPIDTTYYVDDFGVVDSRFLTLILKSLNLAQQETSTAIPGLNREDAYKRQVSLAPLAEQDRIVAAIERLTARIAGARDRLARVPKILKCFRQAVLAAACSGRLTEDWRDPSPDSAKAARFIKTLRARASASARSRLGALAEPDPEIDIPPDWSWLPLHVLCEEIVDCPHSTPKWTPNGQLCVRTTNFKPGMLDLTVRHYVAEETFNQRISRLKPRPRDILYSREGGILGIACMVPPDTELCLGQRMMLLRPWPEIVPDFVMQCLNSTIVLNRVRELTGGTASPHLNVGDIKQFQIPVPPPAEQAEIVLRVESLTQFADAIQRRVAAAAARADKLTQAVLAKAFRGELVPTEAELARAEGRPYESAAELLTRITSHSEQTRTARRRTQRTRR